MCHQGDGGASVASGVSARRCRQIPSRAKRQKLGRTDHAFEAVSVYNTYNVYNWLYNLYNCCTTFEFVLIGSDGTGSARNRGRCGPAAAGRAGPFDRKEQSFFPRHFGPSGLRSLREERYSSQDNRNYRMYKDTPLDLMTEVESGMMHPCILDGFRRHCFHGVMDVCPNVDQSQYEPFRRVHCRTPPRRFFRTVWRSMYKRLLASHAMNTA